MRCVLQTFLRWLDRSFTLEYETGKTCPDCGGRIVRYHGWDGEVCYCKTCQRIDDPT